MLRNGWIQGAHSRASVEEVKRRAEQWARRGAPVELFDKTETDRHLGTTQYHASWIDRRGGAVQPLAYARGLARAAIGAGAAIHGETKGDASCPRDQPLGCDDAARRPRDRRPRRHVHQRLCG